MRKRGEEIEIEINRKKESGFERERLVVLVCVQMCANPKKPTSVVPVEAAAVGNSCTAAPPPLPPS